MTTSPSNPARTDYPTIGELPPGVRATLTPTAEEHPAGRRSYRFVLEADRPVVLPELRIGWTQPATNVRGVWTSGALYEKRLRADWEEADASSRISVDAPVVSVFGHDDENRVTFAWSDATGSVRLAAPVREEDNLLYCSVRLFTDVRETTVRYEALLLVDHTARPYHDCLADVAAWWEDHHPFAPAPVPPAAYAPIYSTWYAYHQVIDPTELLAECRIAKDLGYGTIIVDDGWQTLDDQRGYAYTGDWEPDRFTEMGDFVDQVHALDMRAMIWYSVPFCGPKSRAYQRFRGKFLTENHRWAPVFDPRYPEVRAYLVDKYVRALQDWRLDGLKLDFIDDFRDYPETPTGATDGRDLAGVNEGVDRLMADIATALHAVKPDVLIEFRQRYVGPALRRVGNLFRAFDCPNDSVTNRVRTTDVRLIGGSSLTTSDMFTWHPEESVEAAALQLTNILFSVPQLSVRLAEQPPAFRRMIAFWTGFYNDHRAVLMGGRFVARRPLDNYPLLAAETPGHRIVGVYGGEPVRLHPNDRRVDVINGKLSAPVVLHRPEGGALPTLTVYDCQGRKQLTPTVDWGVYTVLSAPPSGLLCLTFPATS